MQHGIVLVSQEAHCFHSEWRHFWLIGNPSTVTPSVLLIMTSPHPRSYITLHHVQNERLNYFNYSHHEMMDIILYHRAETWVRTFSGLFRCVVCRISGTCGFSVIRIWRIFPSRVNSMTSKSLHCLMLITAANSSLTKRRSGSQLR